MPTITFTLSAGDLTKVTNALSVRFGYSATLPNGDPNPQTAGEFVRLRIGQWVKEQTLEHEQNLARVAITVPPVVIT